MDKIVENLYLGDLQGASNLFLLKRNVLYIFVNHLTQQGVTHILQVAAGFQPFYPGVIYIILNFTISLCFCFIIFIHSIIIVIQVQVSECLRYAL